MKIELLSGDFPKKERLKRRGKVSILKALGVPFDSKKGFWIPLKSDIQKPIKFCIQ
ncbi:hypothetical protein P872_07300 [Rhodonellum psychrophilum GCM71 = DSM 17998]|uniref:Uncharacterized protein n=1 Tax=Rhodonellum psychrophilum GCM71 = DSM 17998 TaxID=1123057 RepID=U5BNS9_9BACT|nr:hypothetical protein P872_07300 [Rhodonellum psychrophilum GCM71 = DSM 17998]